MGSSRVVLVLSLAATVFLAGLGAWQVRRLGESNAEQAAAAAGLARPPAGNDEAREWGDGPPGGLRMVRLEGSWKSGEFRIPAFHAGEQGYRVVRPFLPKRWPYAVLVDMGWVGQGFAGALPEEPVLEGLALPATAGAEARVARGVWRAVAPRPMGDALAHPMARWFVVAGEMRSPDTGGGAPVTGWVLPVRRTPHGPYAATWFGLALLTLVYGVGFALGWIEPPAASAD